MEVEKLLRIARRISRVAREIPQVRAVAVYGSVAQGFADELTDLNLVCFCAKIPEPPNRANHLLKLEHAYLKNGLVPAWRIAAEDFLYFRGKNITLTYKLISEYNLLVSNIASRARVSRQLFREALTFVYNTRVLWDPHKIIAKWKKKLPPSSEVLLRYFLPPLAKFLDGEWPYDSFEKAIKRGDLFYLGFLFSREMENFMIALHALNGKHYFMPKWAIKSISKFPLKPRDCVKKIQRISELGNSGKELEEKLQLFRELISDLLELYKERVFRKKGIEVV